MESWYGSSASLWLIMASTCTWLVCVCRGRSSAPAFPELRAVGCSHNRCSGLQGHASVFACRLPHLANRSYALDLVDSVLVPICVGWAWYAIVDLHALHRPHSMHYFTWVARQARQLTPLCRHTPHWNLRNLRNLINFNSSSLNRTVNGM